MEREQVRVAVHDLNNMMQAMWSLVALARRRLQTGNDVSGCLDEMEGILRKTREIVGALE
jgi:hypothetical protein